MDKITRNKVESSKIAYKELLSHINNFKFNISKYIEEYENGGRYSVLFDNINMTESKISVIEALKILEEELNKVNV